MTSRKLQIFKFVLIEMFSPCVLNSRVISFLVRSDCGPLAFLRSTSNNGFNNVGLYRDDGLVLLRNASGPQSERTRKDITREFKTQGLNISISTNLKICNFLFIFT